jgi:RNA-splicing ligase RtcB
LGKDLNGDYWFTIHTGSRNFGKLVCDYWQSYAKDSLSIHLNAVKTNDLLDAKLKFTGSDLGKQIGNINEKFSLFARDVDGMDFLIGSEGYGYLYDMLFAQRYAELNRSVIASIILSSLGLVERDRVETVHNFIDFRDFIVRKGAIRSYIGERMLVPFNPRDGVLICEGRSNPDFNYSGPHGAGRLMSRTAANKLITDEMADEAMSGVYASAKPKDESPLAYKDASMIEEMIEPTANIINRIIPVMNMKSS